MAKNVKKDEEVTHINVEENIEKGNYANFCITTGSFSEIILDFAVVLPVLENPIVFSRILMSPSNAKRLVRSLTNTLNEWERINGAPIELPEDNEVVEVANDLSDIS